jgi:hypothetical protein
VGQLLEPVAGVEFHPAWEWPISVPVGERYDCGPVAQEINDLSWDIMVEQELHGMMLSLSVLLMNAKRNHWHL